MIKPRRIGHATFETPDLEKTIAYYDRSAWASSLAEREKDRAFLASKIGLLAIQLNKAGPSALHQAVVRSRAQFRFRRHWPASLRSDGIKSELRNDSIPGIGPGADVQGQQGHDHRAVQGMELSRQARAGRRHRAAQARPRRLLYVRTSRGRSHFYEKVLGFRVSDWIGDFFVLHALQPRPSHGEFLHAAPNVKMHHIAFELKDFIHLQNSCDLFGTEENPDHLGTAAAWPRAQRRHLSSQSGRSGGRVLLRARPDEGRGARLFRAAAVAPRHAAAAEDLDAGQTSIWGPPPTPDFHRTQV